MGLTEIPRSRFIFDNHTISIFGAFCKILGDVKIRIYSLKILDGLQKSLVPAWGALCEAVYCLVVFRKQFFLLSLL